MAWQRLYLTKLKRSRLAFVEQGDNQLYVEVLPFLSPLAARSLAAGVAALSVAGVAFIWRLGAPTPVIGFIFTMITVASGLAALVALLGDIEYPKLWLEAGKLTVQWHVGHVEAVRIGRHSAIVLLSGSENEPGLAGFTVQGEDGVLCFREQIAYEDFALLLDAIDRVCFEEKSKSHAPPTRHATAARPAPLVGAQAAWSKRIRMLVDEPKRLEFLILPATEGLAGVVSLGIGCCIAVTIGLYFLNGSPAATSLCVGGVLGLLLLAGWFDWVTKRTRVKVDTAQQQADIVKSILGIPLCRRLALAPTTVVGLRPVSITNDVPSFGIALGTAGSSVCFGRTLDNDEAGRLMHRLREVIGVAEEADAFFSVALHEQLTAGSKSKEVLETQLPLDSMISVVQYDDDRVQIRLPAVEYVSGRIAIGMLLAASVAWTWSWLVPIWTTFGDQLPFFEAVFGGLFPVAGGLVVLLLGLYGVIGHRLLTITPNKIAYGWCLGWFRSRHSAKHASGLTKKLGTNNPHEKLHSLPSVQRGLHATEIRPSSGYLPQHLESLAFRIGQKQRTRRELASLLTVIHREWPKAHSLQPDEA